MILKTINIENLGPFVGMNCINTNHSTKKSIFLIGGKNGAGKTTFFTSIKLCLYGCKAFGYEVINSAYYKAVKKIFNDKELLYEKNNFSCEVVFEFGDGENEGVYSVKRSWSIINGIAHETYQVKKDSILLTDEQLNDFENLLMQTLPPGLFDFYFFDGEKISDLVFEDGKSNSFKDAFIKLIGLDDIDFLVECFRKNSEKSFVKQDIISNYKIANKHLEEILAKIKDIDDKINLISDENLNLETKIKAEKKKYIKSGGIKPEELQRINASIIEQETKREISRKELKEYANTKLPFVILKKELFDLQNSLTQSESQVDAKSIEYILMDKRYKKIVDKYLNLSQRKEFLKDISKLSKNNNINLNITKDENIFLRNQIAQLLSTDPSYYIKLENELKSSVGISKAIRTSLNGLHTENFASYNKLIDFLTKQIEKNNSKKEKLIIDKVSLASEFTETKKNYDKAKKEYEDEIKRSSVHSKSALAFSYFSKLESDLIKTKTDELISNFKICFNSIINKKNLIDGIYIDDELSIYPYRNVSVSNKEIVNILEKLGDEKFIDEYGLLAFKKIKRNTKDVINLPIKINKTLSEGENQVYLMSLYYAMSKLSKSSRPFVIDTPFGRIDKQHRVNLMQNFLLKLNGQLIILSTDEEINNQNLQFIKKNLSSCCTFENGGEGKTNIVIDEYFGVKL